MFDIKPYKVYVKTDENGRITAINSDAFLSSLEGWQEIDSGFDDMFHHAQGNYLDKPLIDNRGLFNYILKDGKPQERTEEEKNAEYKPPVKVPTLEERMEAMEKGYQLLKALVEKWVK